MGAIDRDARISVNPRVQHRELTDGEGVLLHLDTAAYHGLNATGSLIWRSIGSGRTFEELVGAVRAELDDVPETLEDEVAAFIGSLVDRDLLLVTRSGAAG